MLTLLYSTFGSFFAFGNNYTRSSKGTNSFIWCYLGLQTKAQLCKTYNCTRNATIKTANIYVLFSKRVCSFRAHLKVNPFWRIQHVCNLIQLLLVILSLLVGFTGRIKGRELLALVILLGLLDGDRVGNMVLVLPLSGSERVGLYWANSRIFII